MADTQGSIKSLSYPSNINNDEFECRRVVFMALTGKSLAESNVDIYEQVKANGLQSVESSQVKGMVTLPLTAQINDSQSHSWSQADYLSVVETAMSGLDKYFEKSNNKVGQAVGAVAGGISGTIKLIKAADPAMGAITDAFGVRKPMLNPGQYQNYSKSELRSFSFNFTFIPENESESREIIEIIKFFKMCSSPSLPFLDKSDTSAFAKIATRMVMLSPCTWEIFISNSKINELLSFHKCVCTNVTATYGDSEKMAMFSDGMVKQITLSLSFSESELQFSDAYGDVVGGEWRQLVSGWFNKAPDLASELSKSADQSLNNAGMIPPGLNSAEDTANDVKDKAKDATETVTGKLPPYIPQGTSPNTSGVTKVIKERLNI